MADADELRELQQEADERVTAALAEAREVRAMLVPLVLRAGFETAHATLKAGLMFGRRDEEITVRDGSVWHVHAHYEVETDVLRLTGHPRTDRLMVRGIEQLAQAMGASGGAFDYAFPLTYATLAISQLDVQSAALMDQSVVAREDLRVAEELESAWMALVELESVSRGDLGAVKTAIDHLRNR